MEPCVIFNSVLCKVVLHRLNILRQSKVNQSLSAFSLIGIEVFIAVYIGKFLCTHLDVLAVVAVLGQFNSVLALVYLLISDVKRQSEFVNLIACVIDVELTADLIACTVKHGGKTVAECAASCVAHVHRTCRVSGNKFNVDPLALAVVGAAVVLALGTDILENIGIVAVAEIEIDKSGACYLDSLEVCAAEIHFCGKSVGDLSRSVSQLPCPSHCGIG